VDTKTEFLPEGITDHTPMTISFQEFRSTNKFGNCDMWAYGGIWVETLSPNEDTKCLEETPKGAE